MRDAAKVMSSQGRATSVPVGRTLFIKNVGGLHFFKLDEVEQQQ
jgi:hypothetical protein